MFICGIYNIIKYYRFLFLKNNFKVSYIGMPFLFFGKFQIDLLQPSFLPKISETSLISGFEHSLQTPTACTSSRSHALQGSFLSSICTKTMQTFVLVINVKKYHAFILHDTPPHLAPHSPYSTTSIPLTSLPPSFGSSAAVKIF